MTELTVSLLTGQLKYVFEDRPELRRATPQELTAYLNREDRRARARARNPLGTTQEVEAQAAELDDRITEDMVREALARLRPD